MTQKSDEPVKWRCTLPAAADSLGIGFDTADGTSIRLHLDLESARHLSQTLAEELRNRPPHLPPGLRRGELLGLKPHEYREDRLVLDPRTKNGRPCMIPLHSEAQKNPLAPAGATTDHRIAATIQL